MTAGANELSPSATARQLPAAARYPSAIPPPFKVGEVACAPKPIAIVLDELEVAPEPMAIADCPEAVLASPVPPPTAMAPELPLATPDPAENCAFAIFGAMTQQDNMARPSNRVPEEILPGVNRSVATVSAVEVIEPRWALASRMDPLGLL
nr:hypothetical protein [Burkholderia sp. A1]